MNQRFAVLAVLVTTFMFTVTGVCVGYLASSASLRNAPASANEASTIVFMTYLVFTTGGVIVGLGLSLFAVWLTGPIKRD